MPAEKGYPNGKDERTDVKQVVVAPKKTSVPRKGKRTPNSK